MTTSSIGKLCLAGALAAASVVLYLVFFALYPDRALISQWFLGSLAFLPVQVLLVTMILDGMLSRRERIARLKKLNIVIGVFYSEVGNDLLTCCLRLDRRAARLKEELAAAASWPPGQLAAAAERYREHQAVVDTRPAAMAELRALLAARREVLTALMANPSVLEHETFTDLLWSVFHLAEELSARGEIHVLSEEDAAHLQGDVQRTFPLLISEWLSYLRHLREDYPHLFSLAARMNPFDPAASAVVQGASRQGSRAA